MTRDKEMEFLAEEDRDALDALIRLYPIGRIMDRAEAERRFGTDSVLCLEALQLLVENPNKRGEVFAPVMIHPTPSGEIMVCDRGMAPDGTKVPRNTADALYPALFANTIEFVERFPDTPCDSLLEIGTGTGTAAIAWARHASQVWATDIADRAVHFAEFNCRLAGAGNIRVVKGDMYEPVDGMTFDRIASHPPFVPARESEVIFRDGGNDGEQLVRRVIEGLPRFLRPGGMFWGSFMISDRAGELAEQRIRNWLGEKQGEFDIGFGMDARRTRADTLAGVISDRTGTLEEVTYFDDLWKANKTEYLVHASVLIRRRPDGEGATVRVHVGKGFMARDLEKLLDWEVAQSRAGFVESLLESRPAMTPLCELRASHRLENGKPVSEEYTFVVEAPVRSVSRVPGWLARMLMACDGSRTAREQFHAVKAAGEIPEDGEPETSTGNACWRGFQRTFRLIIQFVERDSRQRFFLIRCILPNWRP
jgi:SAM-dependent methyltransferase